MKKLFTILAVGLILAACGGQAQAQVIDLTYKSGDSTQVFNLANTRSIYGAPGRVALTGATTLKTTTEIADGTGAVYAAIIADPKFLAQFVQVGASTRWINATQVFRAHCNPSINGSRVFWNTLGQFEDIPSENCATAHALLNRTVN